VTTILLVDDNAVVRQILGLILLSNGKYRVLEAATQREAVDQYEQWGSEIDLLIADVCVGGQSGRAIANELTTLCPQLRVLFISGYPKDHLVGNGLLGPDDALLAKPFSPETLFQRVCEVLTGSHQTRIVARREQSCMGEVREAAS
jgi:two-component system, cell cycle sensor histidine kinase and response regulator CckA